MEILRLVFFVVTASSWMSYAMERFDGYKVLRISSGNASAVSDLERLSEISGLELDFWSDTSLMRPFEVMVAPRQVRRVREFLRMYQMDFEVTIPNVQKLLDEEQLKYKSRVGDTNHMNWEDYQRLEVIHDWMDDLESDYPHLATVMSIGESYEGRDLKMLRISSGGKPKPAIYVDGGIHAREWISPATVTYIINELLTKYERHPYLLDNLDWYFVPVSNPDGYEYSHRKNRLWRKTRSETGSSRGCVGVDGNRNYDFHWREAGSSTKKCSNTYAGSHPFSEPESNATATFLSNKRHQILAYITFHSYKQMWLIPWGFTDVLPDDYEILVDVAQDAVNTLRSVHGTEYLFGASNYILYANSGNSRDWAKGVAGIKFSYTVELRDTGKYGFLLPPELIKETGEETWAAIRMLGRRLIKYSKKGGRR